MDETPPEEIVPSSSAPDPLVSAADFDAVDFEAPIRGLQLADVHEMFTTYQRACASADEAKDGCAHGVYRLLATLCGIEPPRVSRRLFGLSYAAMGMFSCIA